MGKLLFIHNARLVDSKIDAMGTVVVENGKISKVLIEGTDQLPDYFSKKGDKALWNADVYDAKGLVLMPAFIDMHSHFRYPGQTHKEDLNTGCHAAAAGGYGTVVLMPNTTPVVSSVEDASLIRDKSAGFNCVDVLQTISITKDFDGKTVSHLNELTDNRLPKGCLEVPVVTEDGKDVADDETMLKAMKICAEKGVIVSCHCENPALVPEAKKFREERNFAEAERVLAEAEDSFTARNIELALKAGCRINICHCSTAKSLDYVRKAKSTPEGKKLVTCEVTPHHLALSCEDEGFGEEFVNPPLRSRSDRAAVIEALKDGTADIIATDHAPHTLEEKRAGACGFTGLETAFSAVCTKLVHEEGFSLKKISALMSAKPAEILGLKKGRLLPGYAADLVLVDPDEEYTVCPADFCSKGKYTPLEGKTLKGRVKQTFFAGTPLKKA